MPARWLPTEDLGAQPAGEGGTAPSPLRPLNGGNHHRWALAVLPQTLKQKKVEIRLMKMNTFFKKKKSVEGRRKSCLHLSFPKPEPTKKIVSSVGHVQLFATPWTAARQASLSFTISQSLLKLIFNLSLSMASFL